MQPALCGPGKAIEVTWMGLSSHIVSDFRQWWRGHHIHLSILKEERERKVQWWTERPGLFQEKKKGLDCSRLFYFTWAKQRIQIWLGGVLGLSPMETQTDTYGVIDSSWEPELGSCLNRLKRNPFMCGQLKANPFANRVGMGQLASDRMGLFFLERSHKARTQQLAGIGRVVLKGYKWVPNQLITQRFQLVMKRVWFFFRSR